MNIEIKEIEYRTILRARLPIMMDCKEADAAPPTAANNAAEPSINQ